MKFRLILSCAAGLLGSLAISAQADTQLAHVTNNVVDSGSCSIVNVNSNSNSSTYRLTCGTDIAYVTGITSIPGSPCTLNVSSGYSVTGGCTNLSLNNYTLFKTTPPASPVYITDVYNKNTTSNPSCSIAVQSGMSGGGYTYVGYNVTCSGTVIGLTLTYNNSAGTCSVGGNGGYTFYGGCDSFSIYKNP
ncbi:hypothetical protein GCM10011613_00490 [Cellvibrio zantedeschiae]|uniref:Uncharacterized protein n=1 Tax=Cellvibrio zantedeschiae TaxID=1237077 RepID=A0ABQ3AP36_9GAMM|nr:hypothetical protein [Cellvibrio zantedeschiae]GGY61047.1 hypothetical protein GCM10011613_00490 [Cellvibrio zantedeschiae]